ncbi:MAG: helix-turn-helix transcriptional regulator [Planctomycetes bacterium]|nr:helix-turn-helix transcriptional regulator [Planctomycetota bacterium]
MKNIDGQLYELHAEMCKVFTSAKRLEVINALRNGEKSVGILVKELRISQANLSQHLGILREKGVVKTRREGTTVFYSLAFPKIIKAFDIIREMLMERIARAGRMAVRL